MQPNPEGPAASASSHGRVHIADYDPAWPLRFAELAASLRNALGHVAIRIDHIGSTSVPGLAAKPVIDLQISVVRLEPVDPFGEPLQRLGIVYRFDNPERTKAMPDQAPLVTVHHFLLPASVIWRAGYAGGWRCRRPRKPTTPPRATIRPARSSASSKP